MELGTLFAVLLGAGISALGAWLQHRLSLKQQREQQKIDRKAEVDRRGRQRAEDAIDALRVLHDQLPRTLDGRSDEASERLCSDALGRLQQTVDYLSDAGLRRTVEAAHGVLDMPEQVSRWSSLKDESVYQLVAQTCSNAREGLGAYLRGEDLPGGVLEVTASLEQALAEMWKELDWQYKDQRQAELRARKKDNKRGRGQAVDKGD